MDNSIIQTIQDNEKEINNLASEFNKLQSLENEGRGIKCVRTIVNLLKRRQFKDAENVAFNDHDKIRNYPAIHNLSIKTFPKVKELYR